MMAVVALSDTEQAENNGEWERVDCDIIIVPRKRYENGGMKNMRLDQVAMTLSDDDAWKEKK